MDKVQILYAEDELALGKIVKESLESRGFQVVWITDGQSVLSAFKKEAPDVCVIDIMMPNKDGYFLAQAIREQSPKIPLIFLSAKTQTEDVVKGFATGADDYMRKPFSIEELIVRINNVLRRKNESVITSDSAVIKIGIFELNLKQQTLTHADKNLKLSHRETVLLKLLVESKNNVIERKSILLSVWGDDSFFNSRNLDVYINKLRNYFKADPSIVIFTVKGVGYRFILD